MVEEPGWLTIAQDEARTGIYETRGGENPRILEYWTAVDLKVTEDEVPWCSAFVNWCLLQCGYSATRQPNARSFERWGRKQEPPAYGSIVVLKRGQHAWQGHVGFLIYRDTPRTLLVLGGNQHDSVCIESYKQSAVLGYRWPAEGELNV